MPEETGTTNSKVTSVANSRVSVQTTHKSGVKDVEQLFNKPYIQPRSRMKSETNLASKSSSNLLFGKKEIETRVALPEDVEKIKK